MNKLLVILGPTSTGKTDMALNLAKKFNGELISADSRQVYKGLDLGTGKLPGKSVKVEKGEGYWIIDGVKVWLYDVVSPAKQYTVFNFVKDAEVAIDQIKSHGKLPIIVGGTNFYIRGLLEGIPSLGIPMNEDIRKRFENLSVIELQNQLQKLDMKRWNLMNTSDRQNPRRLIRAIELALFGVKKIKKEVKKFDVFKIGLIADKEILYKRSDKRVVSRINKGMIEETIKLNKNGLNLERMKQLGLEYGVLADYLENKIKSKKDLVKIMQLKIHGYIRRQLTWIKKEKNINWFDITNKKIDTEVENLVSKWYHQSNAS